MATTTPSADFEKATDYSFKDEDIQRAQALAGKFSAWPHREHLSAATEDGIRNFARSYGDDNPLFNDANYWEVQSVGRPDSAPDDSHCAQPADAGRSGGRQTAPAFVPGHSRIRFREHVGLVSAHLPR